MRAEFLKHSPGVDVFGVYLEGSLIIGDMRITRLAAVFNIFRERQAFDR